MIDAGLDGVRAELTGRIAAIDRRSGRAPAGDLVRELDQLRRIAHRHGLLPAVTVARLLEAALARGEQGPLVHGWLALLGDAVVADRRDAAACDAFAAACSVRLG